MCPLQRMALKAHVHCVRVYCIWTYLLYISYGHLHFSTEWVHSYFLLHWTEMEALLFTCLFPWWRSADVHWWFFSPITETCALLMVSWLNMLISFYVILFLTFPPLQRKMQLLNNLIVKRSSIIHSFSQTLEQMIVIFVMPLVFVV